MKNIRKRTAANLIAKNFDNAPEYLLGAIMDHVHPRAYPTLSKMMVPMLMKLKAKHLENILKQEDGEIEVHVKTT